MDALRSQEPGVYFTALAGEWRLTRRASDGTSFEGKAHFRAIGEKSLALSENGIVRMPQGPCLNAGRRWLWQLTALNEFEIHFDEAEAGFPGQPGGRLYHRFKPQSWRDGCSGEAQHLCGGDRYFARYRLSCDRLEIAHRVSGPNKDYRLVSRFQRD